MATAASKTDRAIAKNPVIALAACLSTKNCRISAPASMMAGEHQHQPVVRRTVSHAAVVREHANSTGSDE